MLFNFDSDENIKFNKIPSVKSINKLFCGKKGVAGLWISNDNLINCGWEKDCKKPSCDSDCICHFKHTVPHVINAVDEEVYGKGVTLNRICVLRRSPLIRLLDKGFYGGVWKKGDGEIKDKNGKKKYICARRYLIIFLDENNKPLHNVPLQMTLKGTFQMNFDDTLLKFRKEIQNVYLKETKRTGRMNEIWFSMCVFVPRFESKLVGKTLKSEACSIKDYEIPTEQNWTSLCVGRDQEINEFIYTRYLNSESWMKRYEENFIEKTSEEEQLF